MDTGDAKAVVIGIGGASGSGKTTLARELARELGGCHFSIDSYYRDLSHLGLGERDAQNFDDPRMIEVDLLADHVARLRGREMVRAPQYDFATHTRDAQKAALVTAETVLLVEGNFALHFDELRPLYDLAIYVDAPDALCFERRLARDLAQRGRSEAGVRAQYEATVRPMAETYIYPSRQHADLIVDGSSAVDWMVEQVRYGLRRRGLLRSD